ncbi:MAG: DUF167 domain-containing protein [Opitutales bacterium]|nr:DUF167 domain-containing protein [Opitutales bacterium]
MTRNSESCELNVRVIPNASRDEIVGWHDGALKVKVSAQPESGKANKAVCALIKEKLKVSGLRLAVCRGHFVPIKVIRIDGLNSSAMKLMIVKNDKRYGRLERENSLHEG